MVTRDKGKILIRLKMFLNMKSVKQNEKFTGKKFFPILNYVEIYGFLLLLAIHLHISMDTLANFERS